MKRMIAIAVLVLAFVVIAAAEEGARVISLNEAMEMALKNNTSLQASELNAESTKWGYAQAISGWMPKAYVKSGYTRLDDNSVNRANASYNKAKDLGVDTSNLRPSAYADTYQTSIVAVQPITNGGAEWAAIKAGLSSKHEKDSERDLNKLTLKQSVEKAYYGVLQAQAMLDVAKEADRLADENLKLAQAKFELGQIAKAELLRWQVNKANSEGALVEAQNAYMIAKANLSELIGIGMDERYDVEQLPEQIPQDTIDSMLNELKNFQFSEEHPLMKQMSATVDLAKSERLVAYSNALPSLNFTYTYSWETDNTIQLDGYESWTANVMLEIPIFQSGYGFFGIKKSYKSVAAAKSGYLESKRMLMLQTFSAKRNLEAAVKKLETSQKGLESARENIKLAQESYKVGLTSQLELLDAQLAYQNARSDVVNSVAGFLSAKADWEYVVGK